MTVEESSTLSRHETTANRFAVRRTTLFHGLADPRGNTGGSYQNLILSCARMCVRTSGFPRRTSARVPIASLIGILSRTYFSAPVRLKVPIRELLSLF